MQLPTKLRRPRTIADLITSMASGATLIKTYCHSEEMGSTVARWSLNPGGHTVKTRMVDRLFALECLTPIGDGLFDDDSQSFAWVEGSQAKFSKKTIEKLPDELQPEAAA